MFFKINKLKATLSPAKLFLLVIIIAGIFLTVQFINERRFSDPENALYENLMQDLVKQDICENTLTCATKINFYRKSGNRIYFNMYSQTDMTIVAKVSKFLVKEGIILSKGKPITLKVYSIPENRPVDYDYFMGREYPLLSLEIEK